MPISPVEYPLSPIQPPSDPVLDSPSITIQDIHNRLLAIESIIDRVLITLETCLLPSIPSHSKSTSASIVQPDLASSSPQSDSTPPRRSPLPGPPTKVRRINRSLTYTSSLPYLPQETILVTRESHVSPVPPVNPVPHQTENLVNNLFSEELLGDSALQQIDNTNLQPVTTLDEVLDSLAPDFASSPWYEKWLADPTEEGSSWGDIVVKSSIGDDSSMCDDTSRNA